MTAIPITSPFFCNKSSRLCYLEYNRCKLDHEHLIELYKQLDLTFWGVGLYMCFPINPI